MDRKEFKEIVINWARNEAPKEWRFGQAVFNYLDQIGIARYVQFKKGIDCFYNDDEVDAFIDAAFELMINPNIEN